MRRCAALPLVNSPGTSITCTTADDLAARIAAVCPFPPTSLNDGTYLIYQTGATGAGNGADNGANNGDNGAGAGDGNNNDNNNAGDGGAAGDNGATDDPQTSLSMSV